jgi:anthranilate synthase component II
MSEICVFDNYDSFTYNLVHYLEASFDCAIPVVKNDDADWSALNAARLIVLSPGPGLPETSNRLMECLETYSTQKAILGVCLGHQALGLHTGAKLKRLHKVWHGKKSKLLRSTNHLMFPKSEMPEVGRYHSWVVDTNTLDSDWKITATCPDKEIMAMWHAHYPWCGVQFHPESVLTDEGYFYLSLWTSLLLKSD